MANEILKKQFLDVKYNELNNLFKKYKTESFLLEDINEISNINKNIRSKQIVSMLNDYKYQFALAFIVESFEALSDDSCCKYISIILKKIWEQYCANLELKIMMSEILIDYKNNQKSEKDAYKQYIDLNKMILKNEIKITNDFMKFSEILKLKDDKQKAISLCENIFKILGIEEVPNSKNGINLMMLRDVTKKSKERKDELLAYIYGCDELKCAIIQVQDNIKEFKFEIKIK